MTGVRRLSAAAYSAMFGFGIVMALLGAVMPVLSARLRFDLAQAGTLFLIMNATMLGASFAVGPLLDRFGMKPPLAAGPLLMGAALLLIAEAASYAVLGVSVILLGAGGALLNSTSNTLIADLHSDPLAKNAALNLLGVFFGIGALFVPFAIGALISRLGLAAILYAAIVLALVTTAIAAPQQFPAPKQGGGLRASDLGQLARHPVVLSLGFLLFFESGNEFVLGGFISTYVTREIGTPVAAASYILAGYWAGIMASRIILSRVLLAMRGELLIAAGAAGTAAGVGLLLLSTSAAVAAISVVIVGFSLAPIFPTTLGIAGAQFAKYSGSVFGILISIALCGGMLMPWIVGVIASATALRAALTVAIFNAVGIVVCLAISRTYSRVSTHTARP
jgi:fucose permease